MGVAAGWALCHFTGKKRSDPGSSGPFKFTYFPLFATGPAVALALANSGVQWEGAHPADRTQMQPSTPVGDPAAREAPEGGVMGRWLDHVGYV